MATFASRLKEYRQKYDLTQTDLAKRLGTTKQNISLYERGDQVPKLDIAFNMANKLNVDVWWLIGMDYGTVPTDGLRSRLLNLVEKLPDEKVKLLLELAKNLADKEDNI